MSRLVVAVPHAAGDALAHEASRHGHDVRWRDAHPARDLADPHPVEGVVVAAAQVRPADLIAYDTAGVPVVILVSTAGERVRMTELGRHELLEVGADWATVELMLAGRIAPASGHPESVRPPGEVIAVWGPGGAPGRTTVAIALAADLADADRRVLLIDADTYGASVAPALGLLDESPGFAAACRLAATGTLTSAELDRLAVPVDGWERLRVLSGIARSSRWPELGTARVEATLQACREVADVVVVDVAANIETDEELMSDLDGPRRNAATLAVLAAADRVIAVGAADPIGLSRLLRTYPEALEHTTTDRVDVVINRVRRGVTGVGDSHIARTLERFGGIRDAHLVPDDRDALDAALIAGRPLAEAAPRSPARLALRALAERVDPTLAGRRQRKSRRTLPRPSG